MGGSLVGVNDDRMGASQQGEEQHVKGGGKTETHADAMRTATPRTTNIQNKLMLRQQGVN